MRVYMRKAKQNKHVAYAGVTGEGVGVIHLHTRLSVPTVQSAVKALGLLLPSGLKHLDRKKFIEIRTSKGALVCTLVDLNLLLLPKHSRVKQDAIDLANALLGK